MYSCACTLWTREHIPLAYQTDLAKLSIVTHRSPRAVPLRSHEDLLFSLLLRGSYREFVDTRTFEYGLLTAVYHPESFVHRDEIGADGGRFFMVDVFAGMQVRRGREDAPLHSPPRPIRPRAGACRTSDDIFPAACAESRPVPSTKQLSSP
jgi:hypothetical protein